MKRRPLRLLAIDLTAKGLGQTLLDAKLGLLHWGFSSLTAGDDAVLVARVNTYIERGKPTALVLENFAPTKGREGAVRRRNLLIQLAATRHLGLCQVSRKVVHRVLGTKTKLETAKRLVVMFPELQPRMPRKRKQWTTEDERMHIFDALGLAVTVIGIGARG